MKRLQHALRRPQISYQPLPESSPTSECDTQQQNDRKQFSIVEYIVFAVLGLAMLWAWNMFLAAGPYFQKRFESNQALLDNFQAAQLSVSTVTNLISTLVLTKLQANASYPKRIFTSLCLNLATFILLSVSTRAFITVSDRGYFGFLIAMIFASSLGTGFMQNGTFAYASAYGRPEYLQAIMSGQAIAGVLPPVAQIASVLAVHGEDDDQQSSKSAMWYFLTAVLVAMLGLLSFSYLSKYHDPYDDPQPVQDGIQPDDSEHPGEANAGRYAKPVPLYLLAWKLRYPATAVFITFCATLLIFPVSTQEIISVNPSPPPLMQKASFIPLAFLLWNTGDLIGRIIPLQSRLSLASHHKMLLCLSILRLAWIPLYMLCNMQPPEVKGVNSRLPTVQSDAFYLIIVQLGFGLTNGYIGSCCMMGANICVTSDEREACGSFMGMILVLGLAVGSFGSFLVSNG